MQNLKSFIVNLEDYQIAFLSKHSLDWKFNESNGKVDVDGDFIAKNKGYHTLFDVEFGVVNGDFNISNNYLTSLKGCPVKVGGSFRAVDNYLEYLKGGPSEVGWSYNVEKNKLLSLEGAPQEIPGIFRCNDNNLKSLIGGPTAVGIHYGAIENPIESLKGAPEEVGEYFQVANIIFDEPWGFPAALEALAKYNDQRVDLIKTLHFLNPDYINSELKKSPIETILHLKLVWNLEKFYSIKKHIKVPVKYRGELDVISDLSSLGF